MSPVSILTSGIGLGVYVPALLIRDQLLARGVDADVEVLEGHFRPESQRRHLDHARACRKDFALAQLSHRMRRGVDPHLDASRLDALFGRWHRQHRRHFIVWSGFWLPVLEAYRARTRLALEIDRCRIDAEVSASFRVHADLALDSPEIWLWSLAERRTCFEIPVSSAPPLPHAQREPRLVVHGGGWGLGTYRDRYAELSHTAWRCDLIVHEPDHADGLRLGDRAFMVDPEWRPWRRDGGAHRFPPLLAVDAGPSPPHDGHALYDRIARSKAIVSKPGGGTLIDSLSSATPVVLLESYGQAEASNAALWEHLGFGISYDRWRERDFDDATLAALQRNLLERTRNGADYPEDYATRRLMQVSA